MRAGQRRTLTLATAAGNNGPSFVPELPAWTLQTRLRSGEGAPSLFSSLLRSDEPGAPPPAAAEVAQASRSHFRRTTIALTCNPRFQPPYVYGDALAAGAGFGAVGRLRVTFTAEGRVM